MPSIRLLFSLSHCVHGKCFVLVSAFLSHSYVPCCCCCCCKYLAIEASSVEWLPVLQALRFASSAARLALQAGAALTSSLGFTHTHTDMRTHSCSMLCLGETRFCRAVATLHRLPQELQRAGLGSADLIIL